VLTRNKHGEKLKGKSGTRDKWEENGLSHDPHMTSSMACRTRVE
jgi:hypothetical protein